MADAELTPEQIAKLKPIPVEPIFVAGFQLQGTGTDFVLYCQRTRALLDELGNFTPHGRRDVVAALAMSPHALKDLSLVLAETIEQFEKAYGKLETEYTRKLGGQQKAKS